MTLEELRDVIRVFAADRDWEQYHTPRNLTLALGAETGELMELFQWKTDAEVVADMRTDEGRQAVGDELADILIYLIRLADVVGVDLAACTARKIEENARRYPIDRTRGNAEKQPH